MTEQLLDVDGAARLLSVSVHTIRAWVRQHRVPVTRLGRRVLFDPRALDRFVRTRTQRVVKRERLGNGAE
ncbi:MAG TPA: helix-turn-helix domain-containing protein [Patescibacteria group bacterium]|nr:helix-turn-helix domain-containing protein [Patescibacteria group bacterium]